MTKEKKAVTAQEITAKIWKMADKLRGNMSAVEYRDYILAFMFYRYLSQKQEQTIKDESYLYPLEDGKSINDSFKDFCQGSKRDLYLQGLERENSYAIAPEYTWATIMEEANNGKLPASTFQDMFDDFKKNVENAKALVNDDSHMQANADFADMFSDINLSDRKLGTSTNERARTLISVINLVDQIQYADENGKDILGTIYEYLIAKFASESGKKSGEFYTPHEVSQILAAIASLSLNKDNKQPSAYDFACGSGSLLLTVNQYVQKQNPGAILNYYGQEKNASTYNMARMNLMMHNVPYNQINLRCGDSLEEDWPTETKNGVKAPKMFDIVTANPPYSADWDNNSKKLRDPRFKDYGLAPKHYADYAFLLHGFYHLSNTGTMCIVLPHGVLFRGHKEEDIRKALLKKNQIDAIIGLPANLFYAASIPTIIMVLKKNKTTNDVLFVDASGSNGEDYFKKGKNQNKLRQKDIDRIVNAYKERKDVKRFSHVASMDEIKANDYNLNIPRYVDTFVPEKPVDLVETTQDIQETNKNIQEQNKELLNMLGDLTSDDGKLQKGLTAMMDVLRGDQND